ncbi:DUF2516 family protein [Nocardioides sp. TF02-7]|uniref:DUF2516 family protein n=1 Tax=Nocardioides sp. TF02-7 TaxID=2917724 RepID=UPI001F06234C|nr:DUF2516 family protein [Nocardioides sp. TF02-7]UMG91161.1 DUF2516 family protein [Nocardioides sp. TF02-7]
MEFAIMFAGHGWAPPVTLPELWITVAIAWVLLVAKIYAFALGLVYSAEAYSAADKLNKATWCLILGLAVVIHLAPLPLGIVNLAMTIAALVFLADVRPALANLRRR